MPKRPFKGCLGSRGRGAGGQTDKLLFMYLRFRSYWVNSWNVQEEEQETRTTQVIIKPLAVCRRQKHVNRIIYFC